MLLYFVCFHSHAWRWWQRWLGSSSADWLGIGCFRLSDHQHFCDRIGCRNDNAGIHVRDVAARFFGAAVWIPHGCDRHRAPRFWHRWSLFWGGTCVRWSMPEPTTCAATWWFTGGAVSGYWRFAGASASYKSQDCLPRLICIMLQCVTPSSVADYPDWPIHDRTL